MTTTTATGAADPYAALQQASAGKAGAKDTASADRFLTMLVTQLKNQDPLNPMDNAQVTSQMAQINAVTGLEKVNQSVQALSTQILQMQALQGASLVGRDVTTTGDGIRLASGAGRGAVELEVDAGAVSVQVLNGAGQLVDTVNLGSQAAGRHVFDWKPAAKLAEGNYSFKVAAGNGKQAVSAQTLQVDRVQSVSMSGDKLQLNLTGKGSVAMTDVLAFN